jgi:uncharacterized protein (DUF305 family)
MAYADVGSSGHGSGPSRNRELMRASRRQVLIVVILALLATTACSRATARSQPTTPPGVGSASELEEIFTARTDSARARFTEPDVRFMTHMIPHHAQAIQMARLAPTHGASPTVQTLAARIINAQQDEIATMQQWLRDRQQPVPEVHITETDVMVHGPEHGMHMPGMLTADQMRELERSQGAVFDRLFLTLMIQHHRGAVTMVDELFASDGAAQEDVVFKLASDVQVDQRTEVARMERMLTALPAGEKFH